MDALSAIAKSPSDEAVPAACYTGQDRFVGSQWRGGRISEASFMRQSSLKLALVLAALWSVPALAQSRAQLGPLCTSEGTPVDQQIDACNKIIALRVFSGEKLATIYFWRAVGWNKKGDYGHLIADTTEALRLQPGQIAFYNMRGSAYYDKGEYDIAIPDFSDALRIGPPSGTIFHNRGNAWRAKGNYARAIADYDEAIRLKPGEAYSYQNRGSAKQALGDLDGALADINEAIRLNPALPSPLINRAVIWRAKGDGSSHRRRHRSDAARQGQRPRQHHDAARQRADIGLYPARPRL